MTGGTFQAEGHMPEDKQLGRKEPGILGDCGHGAGWTKAWSERGGVDEPVEEAGAVLWIQSRGFEDPASKSAPAVSELPGVDSCLMSGSLSFLACKMQVV